MAYLLPAGRREVCCVCGRSTLADSAEVITSSAERTGRIYCRRHHDEAREDVESTARLEGTRRSWHAVGGRFDSLKQQRHRHPYSREA